VCMAATPEECIDLVTLHQCLAHIAPDTIRKMVKSGAVEGIQLIDDGSTLVCDACEQAKVTCKQIRKEHKAPLTDTFGTEVHTDLWGPSPMPSLGGKGYYVIFTNDYSHYTRLTPLRSKDQTLEVYKSFAAWAHTQHGAKINAFVLTVVGSTLETHSASSLQGRALSDTSPPMIHPSIMALQSPSTTN